jgi:hypothetical protein
MGLNVKCHEEPPPMTKTGDNKKLDCVFSSQMGEQKTCPLQLATPQKPGQFEACRQKKHTKHLAGGSVPRNSNFSGVSSAPAFITTLAPTVILGQASGQRGNRCTYCSPSSGPLVLLPLENTLAIVLDMRGRTAGCTATTEEA